MWYNREIDVLRIQYFSSVVPDVSASGQLNVFFYLCFVVTIYLFLLMCISVFVSVGLVSRRELGGILCTIISLDILLYSLP
jgi:hypothetical protein